MPPGAQAAFDENFIALLSPRLVARWARRHGLPLQQMPADAPVREVLALPTPPGMQSMQVLVLTAAIEAGASRRRVLLATGDGGAVLGRRVPSAPRAGLLSVLLLAAALAAALLPRDQPLDTAVAAPVAAASAPGPALGPQVSATLAPPAVAQFAQAPASAVQDTVPASAAPAKVVEPAASAPASSSAAAPAKSPATLAATSPATIDVEPRLGRVELPPLNLPRNRQAQSDAPDAWRAAIGMPPQAPAAPASARPPPATAAAASAATPVAPRPSGPAAFAVSSRVLRTRAEAEQVRDAMQGLLRSSGNASVQVEALAQGDDWLVIGWPFGQRSLAEKARSVLVSRGMRVEVVDS